MRKRSVTIEGHSTSVTLEEEFWDSLKDIAKSKKMSLSDLIAQIDEGHEGNLSSAIRLYVLKWYKNG